MAIEGRGKYLGKKKIELDQELNLPPDTEIFFKIEEIKPISQNIQDQKQYENIEEHPLLQIAKRARAVGRSDLSERHHEVLGDLIE